MILFQSVGAHVYAQEIQIQDHLSAVVGIWLYQWCYMTTLIRMIHLTHQSPEDHFVHENIVQDMQQLNCNSPFLDTPVRIRFE